MKFLFQILCISLFVSCNSIDPKQALLNRADSLMQVQQDSALAFLQGVKQSELTTPAARARYAVLLTQALDKNYISLTDDSLIQTAVQYYDSIGDVGMQAEAHYYLARVHQNKKEKEDAIREFWKVVPLAERVKDTELLSITLGNLGHMYIVEGWYDEADALYFRAECLAVIRKDSTRLATILLKRGRIYAEREAVSLEDKEMHESKAKYYFHQALEIARKTGNQRMVNSVLTHLEVSEEKKSPELQSVDFLKVKIRTLEDTTKYHGYYSALGNAYYKAANYDSAVYYYMKSLPGWNYYVKAGASDQLSRIAVLKGDLKKALYWKDLYSKYKDSAMQSERSMDMVIIEHNLRLDRNDKSAGTNVVNLFICIFVLLVIASLLVWRRVRKSRKEKLVSENRMQEIESELVEKDLQLIEKNKELSRMQGLVEDFEKVKMEIIVLQNETDVLCQDRQEIFMSQLSATKIYKSLLHHIENYNEDEAVPWDEKNLNAFLVEVKKLSMGFTERLSKRCASLNAEDVRFCCLLKAGFNYTEIAKIFARTTNAMYKRRNSIIDKMGLTQKNVLLEDLVLRI